MRPRIATVKPPIIAAQPMALARIARPSAPRPNNCATKGGSSSVTDRNVIPTVAANSISGPMPLCRRT